MMAEEQSLPANKAELMSAIEGEWNLLMQTVARLEAAGKLDTPDPGGWTPKDNLAHLSEWIKVLLGYHLDKRPAHEVMGLPLEITEAGDFEVMNALLVERNRKRSAQDVLAEFKRLYADLTARLAEMSFEEFLKPRYADGPDQGPLLNWVLADSSEHFAEHRETMQKLL
jgi:hypothetical protein